MPDYKIRRRKETWYALAARLLSTVTLLQVCFALISFVITMSHSRHIRILVTEATSDKTKHDKLKAFYVRFVYKLITQKLPLTRSFIVHYLTRVTTSGIDNVIIEVTYLRQRSLYEELNLKKVLLLTYIVKSV